MLAEAVVEVHGTGGLGVRNAIVLSGNPITNVRLLIMMCIGCADWFVSSFPSPGKYVSSVTVAFALSYFLSWFALCCFELFVIKKQKRTVNRKNKLWFVVVFVFALFFWKMKRTDNYNYVLSQNAHTGGVDSQTSAQRIKSEFDMSRDTQRQP